MSFSNTALSGLRAATTELSVIGNNISNSNTIGYKQARTNFGDVYFSGVAGLQTGNGVTVTSISKNFSQSSVSNTGNPLDLALNKDGMFMYRNASGDGFSYSRAGSLQLKGNDGQKFLMSQTDDLIQGYQAVDGTLTSTLGDISVSDTPLPAKATETTNFDVNLDASNSVIGLPFDANDASTYNYVSPVQIYDSLGQSHNLEAYYIKTADNAWDVQVEVDGSNIGTGNLTFTGTGALSSATGLTGLSYTPSGGAASPQSFDIDYNKATQYGLGNSIRNSGQDGYSAGSFVNLQIDGSGIVSANYSNNQLQTIGQVAVAQFNNPQGLIAVGNNKFNETTGSGEPLLSPDNSTSRITAGALEDSNVDLTEQMVALINAQRSFQVNSQTIRASDTVMKEIINLE